MSQSVSHHDSQTKRIAVIVSISGKTPGVPRVINDIKLQLSSLRVPFTIVVVRNGQLKPGMAEYLDALGSVEENIRCVSLDSCKDKQLAIRAGFESIDADAYLVLDTVGTTKMGTLENMLNKWSEGCDCVLVVRQIDSEASAVMKSIYRRIASFVNVPMAYGASDTCLLDKRVVSSLQHLPVDQRTLAQQTARLGFNRECVVMDDSCQVHQSIRARATKHFRQLREGILSHSRLPVRSLYWCAGSAIVFAMASGIFSTIAVANAYSSTIVLSVLVGACMGTLCSLSIGMVILGEYLYRLVQNGPSLQHFALERSQRSLKPTAAQFATGLQEYNILDDVNSIRSSLSKRVDSPKLIPSHDEF